MTRVLSPGSPQAPHASRMPSKSRRPHQEQEKVPLLHASPAFKQPTNLPVNLIYTLNRRIGCDRGIEVVSNNPIGGPDHERI
jgi:hypothetical protein